MRVHTLTVGAFAENCYLVVEGDVAVFVDPGAEPERLADALAESGAQLQAIWLTHAHLDHIGGISELVRRHAVPVYLHRADLPLYRAGARQAAAYGLPFEQPSDPTAWLEEGERLTLGSNEFTVLHLPGHAPGHVAFVSHDACFSGDMLFAGSIGRTDLPLSDPGAMLTSLRRMCELNGDLRVFPGHGPPTTIEKERRQNPFLAQFRES